MMERGGGVGLILDTSSMDSNRIFANPSSTARVLDEMDFFSNDKPNPKSSPSPDHDHHHHLNVNTGLHLLTASVGSDRSSADDGVSSNEDDRESRNELTVMQAELMRVKEENQRLKSMLSQVTSNYNSLHMQFITFMQQKGSQRNGGGTQEAADEKTDVKKRSMVPRQFMELGLAAAAVDSVNDEASSMELGSARERSISPNHNNNDHHAKPGINVREESPEQSSQAWMPNKSPKMSNSASSDQQAQEATMRKARVSVRARSEAPMITDGCQWRKYGQKMAKGNPCPRAYYRCTMAAGCPVRKQVQRCAEDRTILITTYEGNHNHPLPPAAMAMASTTSAAATMLLSGSMSSADSIMNPNFLAKTMLPCSSSLATISASAPFPTVTLDLTQTPNPLQAQRSSSAQFQLSLPNSSPQIFGQSLGGQSKFSGLQMSTQAGIEQKPLVLAADTVSAATAAITADPNFTAALAAAITSIIGNGNSGGSSDHNKNDTS